MKKRRILLFILIIILLAIITTVIIANNDARKYPAGVIVETEYVKKVADNEYVNNSEKMLEEKNWNDIIFSNAVLRGNNDGITLSIDIENKSKEDVDDMVAVLTLKNSSGEIIEDKNIDIYYLGAGEKDSYSLDLEYYFMKTYDYNVEICERASIENAVL